MKKLVLFLCTVTMLVSLNAIHDVHAKSEKNKAKCLEWCKNNKPRCAFCSSNAFCGGPKHDIIASFKKGTGNWYACGLSRRERLSKENERQCREWCEKNEKCEHCSSRKGCGSRHRAMRTWDIEKSGNSWHACEARDWGTRNKVKCEAWCNNKKYCNHCSSLRFCGPHFNPMKDWDGYGKNYSACKKDGHVNRIWDDYKNRDIYPSTRVLVVTLDGVFANDNDLDAGFEWFCEDYIYGTDLAKKVKCISSYASTTTSSKKLSENIINLIHAIKKKANKKAPKVILVGKSMGACKLQHALFKRSLKNYTIDTFFGVDASCFALWGGTKHGKHWQKGDGLLFHRHKNGTPGGVKTLQNFYQMLDNTQTGHVLAFTDQFEGKTNSEGEARYGSEGADFHYSFDRHNSNSQINVNKQDFDFIKMRKKNGKMCNNVHHTHDSRPIDRCKKLRDGIFSYIQRKAGVR